MLDDFKHLVEVSKQVLDTLPKNNSKNTKKYNEVLEEQSNNFENYKSELEKEILKRIKKYTDFPKEEELTNQETQISFIKENLFLLNHYNSSYEKFNLDKLLYKLNRFYKEDLDEVNSNIFECLNIFKKAGIDLKTEDFKYSEVSNKYMQVLLENKDNKVLVKETFEKLYWQCPDLLIHIELNFKYLYYLNQKEFDKCAEEVKNKFIKIYENKNILDEYKNLVIKYNIDKSTSLNLGLNRFLNKELNISDYQDVKIDKCYQYFTNDKNPKTEEEINKMANSAKEYKEYLYFKYIIEDIKKIYSEKDKYKDVLKNKLKQIQKQEKLLLNYNKKTKRKFGVGKINIKINILIKELETLYKELDDDIFCDKVYKHLNDSSSIYDALCLAASHYSYIVKCMKEVEKEGEFILEQEKLIQYILNPYNNLIQNISIVEEKDIPLIICDRYKLSNFHINKELLENESGINEIIDNANKIEVYSKIVSKIKYENLKFVLEAKDVFNK